MGANMRVVVWIIVCASLIVGRAVVAEACSIGYGPNITWPLWEQTEVPLNARIVVDCRYADGCNGIEAVLEDVTEHTAITTAIASISAEIAEVIPSDRLQAKHHYRVTVTVPGNAPSAAPISTKREFTTGTAADTAPPDFAAMTAAVTWDWVPAGEEAEIFGGGMCAPTELAIAEITNYDISPEEILPEHYHLTFSLQGAIDATRALTMDVVEIAAGGERTTFGPYQVSPLGGAEQYVIRLPRRVGIATGSQRRYEITATDILGNTQTQVLEVAVDFAQQETKAATSLGGKPVGPGEDGDGESGDDGDSAASAAGGCSLVIR